jgi:hypothetical protein
MTSPASVITCSVTGALGDTVFVMALRLEVAPRFVS